jgi:LysR family transcriptional regulator, regulator of abg operon
MKLHQLSALVALVDQGSIRGASRALGLTQPALSARLAELEQEIGATLVNRTARGTTLTATGQALLVHARTIGNYVRRAEAEMAQLTSRAAAPVSIGASPLAAVEIVAPLWRSLQQKVPGARLKVMEGQFHELAPYLRDGSLDLAIAQIPPGGKETRAFHFEELVTFPLHVVARKGHPLSSCLKLTDLAEASWVVGAATSRDRSTLEELFLQYHLPAPRIELHCDSITLVLASVAESDLLALLPRPLFESGARKLVALPVEDPIRPLRLGVTTLAGVPLSPAAQNFLELVRERSRKLAKSQASGRRSGTA